MMGRIKLGLVATAIPFIGITVLSTSAAGAATGVGADGAGACSRGSNVAVVVAPQGGRTTYNNNNTQGSGQVANNNNNAGSAHGHRGGGGAAAAGCDVAAARSGSAAGSGRVSVAAESTAKSRRPHASRTVNNNNVRQGRTPASRPATPPEDRAVTLPPTSARSQEVAGVERPRSQGREELPAAGAAVGAAGVVLLGLLLLLFGERLRRAAPN